jgi:hypothetical protein
MSKVYFSHLIFGERYDGTTYAMERVECIDNNEMWKPETDKETEFFTEKHRYYFMGSKTACETAANEGNSEREKRGTLGTARRGLVKIDGENFNVDYDYRRGIKTVFYNDRLGSVNFDMKTGELINDLDGEYEKARKLVDEHDKIVNALMANDNEGRA